MNGSSDTEKFYFKNNKFWVSLLLGVAMLLISLIANFYASSYATESASGSVTDIILSNTRVYDVDGIFVYGALFLVLVIAIVCFLKPQRFPFTLKSIALFIFIRSFFISLTHIGPYPTQIAISSTLFNTPYFQGIFTGADLFFSGHTGLSFLMALLFWDKPILRIMFLAFSVLFAVVVLLGHIHYSIDVVSAYFITFTIFTIAKTIFNKDWLLFKMN